MYRTEKLCRFWFSNVDGFCLQKSCQDSKIIEDSSHILLHCSALNGQRRRLYHFSYTMLQDMPLLGPILSTYLFENDDYDILMQFLLDCSVLPLVIAAKQALGNVIIEKLFKLTRTWCFSLHKSRLELLGRNSNQNTILETPLLTKLYLKVFTFEKHKCLLVWTIKNLKYIKYIMQYVV